MTGCLHFHFSLLCTGEGNGNPLQCSCLENPRDSGAWWAAVYGVAQSWTRLKRLFALFVLIAAAAMSLETAIFASIFAHYIFVVLHLFGTTSK